MNRENNFNKLIICSFVTLLFTVGFFQVGRSQDEVGVSLLYIPAISNQQPTPIPVLPTPKPSPTFPPPPLAQMRGQAKCQEERGLRGEGISAMIAPIQGKPNQFEVVYSHSPDGQVLGKIRGPSYDFLFQRYYDLVDADWWIWVRDGNGERISDLVKIHTDSTLGPDKCQDHMVTFWSDAAFESPPGPYGVTIQANQDGTFTARWFYSDKYVEKIQGFRIHQIFLRDDTTDVKVETVATVAEPWRREFSFTPIAPLTCQGTNYNKVTFSVSAIYIDLAGQERTATGDESLIARIACQ